MCSARVADREVWLSVHEASAMLGVSPATLRRWSAAGEVEAFTTPGGHRRFALSTLQALLPHPSDAPVRLAPLGESPDRMVRVLRRHARAAVRSSAWLRGLDAAALDKLRVSGRGVVVALVEHLDATTREGRADALARAEAAAELQGVLACERGGSIAELVVVFLRFRTLFVSELAAAAVRHGLGAGDSLALVTRGGEAADRALAAMVAAHDRHAAGQGASGGVR